MTNDPAPTRPQALDRPLRIAGWSLAAALMAAPLIAMQFTREVAWTPSDFVFAGVMLGGVGLLFELTFRLTGDWFYRGGVAAALAGAFFTVWATGAVGIIGDEGDPANLLFFWVLAIGLLGAMIARFRARGMACAMGAAAAAQTTVAAIVVALRLGDLGPTLFFTLFWVAAGVLFWKAAQRRAQAGGAS